MAVIISNKSGSGGTTPKAPTVQTFLTPGVSFYTPPSSPSPLYLKVTAIGAGGGGSGSGTATGVLATNGTSSEIDAGASVVLVAGPGDAGAWSANMGGAGGTSVINSPAIVILNVTGQTGGGPQFNSSSANGLQGGDGGATILNGAGLATFNTSGQAAVANTGSGGSGAGAFATNNAYSGTGGGAGASVVVYLPPQTYTMIVGTHGSGGGVGAGGSAGGDGADGIIVVEEYYQ
jgi:hypothetical protein